MRSYPIDSPEAAVRIVAMTLMADGGPSGPEYKVLQRHDAASQLGVSAQNLHQVLQHFCEDLLVGSQYCWNGAHMPDEQTMASMLAEIRDPALRRTVLELCAAVVQADGRIDDGESSVLAAAASQWQLSQTPLQTQAACERAFAGRTSAAAPIHAGH